MLYLAGPPAIGYDIPRSTYRDHGYRSSFWTPDPSYGTSDRYMPLDFRPNLRAVQNPDRCPAIKICGGAVNNVHHR